MTSDPFKLVLEILTPFALRHPLTLDSLLSAAVANATGKIEEATIPEIPLVREFDVFHGSSCHYPRRHVHDKVSRVMALRGSADLSPELFAPNRRGGDYGPIDTKRGDYKFNMDGYPAIAADEVYFWGFGDGERCADLIRNYVMGIGLRVNAGAGQIGAVRVEYNMLGDDYSWVTHRGTPARPLPTEVWTKISDKVLPTMQLPVAVPYRTSPRVDAVFPESLIC